MQLYFHKVFRKQYKKLPHALQFKAGKITKAFKIDPRLATLKNHALRGNMRIIFTEQGNYSKVTFLQIGTHNQVC